MISLSRSLARQFRAVARRAGFTARQAASVRLIATPEALCLFAVNGRVAVAYREPGHFTEVDVTVPLQLFADCEKKSGDLVTIRPGQTGQLVATWEEAGVPQQRVYLTADVAVVPDQPPSPTTFADNNPELLVALRDAMDTTDSAATRYALSCVQLQGNGSLDATDGRQLLVQTGFRFGWRDPLLMEASDVFASRELPQDQPVQIGATADWVTVVAGRWTLHHAISKQGRFPEVHHIIPATTALTTRLQLDPDDIAFLSDRMERLPADEAPQRPVTVDLNGSVAIRARQDAESPVTELVLSRSKRVGAQLRVQTNREFFIRAMDLGFTEMSFVDAETPCVCRDARRTYVWQMLTPDGALPAAEGARRIESATVVDQDPLEGYQLKKPKPTSQPCWTPDQADQIVQAAPATYQAYFSFLRETGCRAGEGKFLMWNDIRFDTGVILIRPKHGDWGSWRPTSGDQRAVPITEKLRALLQSIPQRGPWVFCAPPTKQFPSRFPSAERCWR